MGKQWKQCQTLFFRGSKITGGSDCSCEKRRWSLELSYDKPRQHNKKQRYCFTRKGLYSQSCGFSCGHVWMWEGLKEGWVPKNWCFGTVVLDKTLESPLDYKEIQPVHPKVNKSLIFIGRADAEAQPPVLWPPDGKNWLIRKFPMLGKSKGRR